MTKTTKKSNHLKKHKVYYHHDSVTKTTWWGDCKLWDKSMTPLGLVRSVGIGIGPKSYCWPCANNQPH